MSMESCQSRCKRTVGVARCSLLGRLFSSKNKPSGQKQTFERFGLSIDPFSRTSAPLVLAVLLSCFALLSCTDSPSGNAKNNSPEEKAQQLQKAQLEKGMGAYQQSKYKEAYKIIHPIAEKGDVDSQAILGEMHMRGNGVSRSAEESFKWYLRAAEQGLAESQYLVANMYAHGMGVQQDLAQASVWSQRAQTSGFGKDAAGEEGKKIEEKKVEAKAKP